MEKVSEFESGLKGPPSYKVHWDIVLLAREITKTFDHIFSEFNLNLTDVALISLIDLNDSLTQSQLAKSLGIGKARLGIVIKNLEAFCSLLKSHEACTFALSIIKISPKFHLFLDSREKPHKV